MTGWLGVCRECNVSCLRERAGNTLTTATTTACSTFLIDKLTFPQLVNYLVHINYALLITLNQLLLHFTFYNLNIPFRSSIVGLPSVSGSSKLSTASNFLHHNFVCNSIHSHACPCLTCLSLLSLKDLILSAEDKMSRDQRPTAQLSLPATSYFLGRNFLPIVLFSNVVSVKFFPPL